jgi:hypothetical protein
MRTPNFAYHTIGRIRTQNVLYNACYLKQIRDTKIVVRSHRYKVMPAREDFRVIEEYDQVTM